MVKSLGLKNDLSKAQVFSDMVTYVKEFSSL